MRWLPVPVASASALVLLALVQQITCSGVFELKLKSFMNEFGKDAEGHCCSGYRTSSGECSGVCQTKFRVCLKHYQTTIDPKPPCTFGDIVTPVVGNNSVFLTDSSEDQDGYTNPIKFPFEFSWPGTFSLIVEAWHETNSTGEDLNAPDALITRLATQRWLDVGDEWTEDEHRTSHAVMRYEYRVRCDEHYYGDGCADLCRPRNDTFGHYSCSKDGRKVCLSGWSGEYCSVAVCLPGCHERQGYCEEPNTCICHMGWQGKFCNKCIPYPGCLHGTCHQPWQCQCDEGWGGLFCNQDLNYCTNHKPCQNSGTCFNTGQGSYTCNCRENYTGTDCEVKLDDCAHQPCLNGGTCIGTGDNYTCACPFGWHGRHCETSAETCEDAPCRNSATCVDTTEGYFCLCQPGYDGINCEHQVDECSPNPCLNRGSCVDELNGYRCICPVGFSGDKCEININDCNENPCLNGGTCLDSVNSFKCLCAPGYVGSLCQDDFDDCRTMPCANGGGCHDLPNDFKCTCKSGFTGKDCSVEINKCIHNPCKNGGTCLSHINKVVCKCPDGFNGQLCDSVVRALQQDNISTSSTSIGNKSRHVSDQKEDSSTLSAEQVVLIATFSAAVPLLALVSAIVIMCMKHKRKKEKERADEEARIQNEQNAVNSINKKCLDDHMIVNTLDFPKSKCVNTNIEDSDCTFTKEKTYTLQRTKSHKQLNTDSCYRASILSEKLEKDFDNLCSNQRTATLDNRLSSVSIEPSLCSNRENITTKTSLEKDCNSAASYPGQVANTSSVYVIDDHYQDRYTEGMLATEV